jgi:hypothetical protein
MEEKQTSSRRGLSRRSFLQAAAGTAVVGGAGVMG